MSKKINEMSFFGIEEALIQRKIDLQHPKNVETVKEEAQKEPNNKKTKKAMERAIAILEAEKEYYNNTEKDARRIFASCVRDQYGVVIK